MNILGIQEKLRTQINIVYTVEDILVRIQDCHQIKNTLLEENLYLQEVLKKRMLLISFLEHVWSIIVKNPIMKDTYLVLLYIKQD